MRALGQHTLLEYYGCDAGRLKRARDIKALLCAAVRRGGGTIVKAVFHNFSPYGVSGVVVITESHVTIHTWPEHAYAAVDIFSCSDTLDHAAIRKELRRALGAARVQAKSFPRGL
jgi:S-adenosylmethionine decarboxylase proenzyme